MNIAGGIHTSAILAVLLSLNEIDSHPATKQLVKTELFTLVQLMEDLEI